MTWHVTVRVGETDSFEGPRDPVDPLVVLELDAPASPKRLVANTWPVIDEFGLVPPPAAVDFYHAAAAVFAADLRIPRRSGFDRWTRDIVLHLPVQDLHAWAAAQESFEALLTFLTGDRWRVELRELKAHGLPVRRRARSRSTARSGVVADGACLLSGGLDSFVGAADEFAQGRSLALVSHNASGSATFSSPAQDRVVDAFTQRFGAPRVHHLKFTVYPPLAVSGRSEPSMRSRSVMFVGLGALVASALQPPHRLVIPENGFISLNVPLTRPRLGSLSTRTTHPHVIALMRDLFKRLGLEVMLETPFQFQTKGELLAGAHDRVLLQRAAMTVSCAHPNVGRFASRSRRDHCGYCIPCIIRRAAMAVVGLDASSDYTYDVTREGDSLSLGRARDVRAARIAIERARLRPPRAANVVAAGPLPGDANDLAAFAGVYRRGLDELARFLTNTALPAPDPGGLW